MQFLFKINSFSHKKGLSNSYYKFVYKTISLKYMLSGKGCRGSIFSKKDV